MRQLVHEGCCLYRRGANHDIYINPKNGAKAPIPRHNEIKNTLCILIKAQLHLQLP
ncbi:MAG: addiction module toxin, HicA family [Pseudomonadota bacterium]